MAETVTKLTRRFFELDNARGITEWASQESFAADASSTPELTDRLYRPDTLEKKDKFDSLHRITFRNVSFSKTKIQGMEFSQCVFEDCLFIASRFHECRFHQCRFTRCNFWRAAFEKCYADPWQFRDAIDMKQHANVAVGLFRSLATNAFQVDQRDHLAEGEYYFRRALRHQLKWDCSVGKISGLSYRFHSARMYLFEVGAGYGWRPNRVALTIVAVFVVLMILNHILWPLYGVPSDAAADPSRSLVQSFCFTASILTTLGPGTALPRTNVGAMSMAIQSIIGVLLFALVASIAFKILVRR